MTTYTTLVKTCEFLRSVLGKRVSYTPCIEYASGGYDIAAGVAGSGYTPGDSIEGLLTYDERRFRFKVGDCYISTPSVIDYEYAPDGTIVVYYRAAVLKFGHTVPAQEEARCDS